MSKHAFALVQDHPKVKRNNQTSFTEKAYRTFYYGTSLIEVVAVIEQMMREDKRQYTYGHLHTSINGAPHKNIPRERFIEALDNVETSTEFAKAIDEHIKF